MTTNRESFNRILNNTLTLEGGLTFDSGGLTNYGVTQKTYDDFRTKNKLPKASVKEIKYGEVQDLYYKDFYKGKFDSLSEKVAGVMFDFGVNSGPQTAAKVLQRIVGAEDDGIIGPKTLAAVEEYIKEKGEDSLKSAVIDERANFMKNLIIGDPEKYSGYAKGWDNRIGRMRELYIDNQ